jgi:mRNA interferase RelE/StbE
MGYSVVVPKSVYRDLSKLHPSLIDRMESVLLSLEDTPRPDGVRKLQGYQNRYRIRVSVYRIVYEIDDNQNRIIVLRVAHRGDVYRG